MKNRDYTKFSSDSFKQNNEENNTIEEPTLENEENNTIEEPTLKNEENNEIPNEIIESKTKKGRVFNCILLYLRSDASKKSEPLAILNKNEEVEILIKESTNDFYRVKTSSGIYGFCMKQYIKLS